MIGCDKNLASYLRLIIVLSALLTKARPPVLGLDAGESIMMKYSDAGWSIMMKYSDAGVSIMMKY